MVSRGPIEQLEALSVEVRGSIAEVTLRGPGPGNALGQSFWRELPRVFGTLDADPSVHVVVLLGSESHFTVGLDLNDMPSTFGQLPPEDTTLEMRWKFLFALRRLQGAINSIAECRKPVIAAVSGWCVGGGLDLISAADIRLASADARFSLRETKLAIVADLGSLQRLPGIIGEGPLRELAFTGKDIDAERAGQIGLVNTVLTGRAALLAAAREMAGEIAINSALTVQGVKLALNEGRERRIAEGLHNVSVWNAAFMPSDDLIEALSAFRGKRRPSF